MATTTQRLTAAEYFEVSVEGDRTQLVDGALVVNEPRPIHGFVQVELLVALRTWTAAEPGRGLVLPPVDVVLSDHDVYGPDLVWLADEHVPADLRQRLQRLPDLVVEIRSPGTWRYDVGRKKATYERAGLPELWLVDDVARVVLVFRRSQADAPAFDVELELDAAATLASPSLPGFALPVARLFPPA